MLNPGLTVHQVLSLLPLHGRPSFLCASPNAAASPLGSCTGMENLRSPQGLIKVGFDIIKMLKAH